MRKKLISSCTGKKLFIITIVLLMIGCSYQPRNAIAAPGGAPDLGPISHYNAIIFGDMTAVQADIEGALAVEGNAQFGGSLSGYDIGAAAAIANPYQMGEYNNPNHYPSLLLGGAATHNGIAYSKWVNIYNGPAVVRDSYLDEFKNISLLGLTEDPQGTDENSIKEFFQSAKGYVQNTSEVLQKGNDKTVSVAEFEDLSTLNLSDYDNEYIETEGANTIVINVDSPDSINFGTMNMPSSILSYDVIVINVPATSVSFGLGEGGEVGAMKLDGNIVNTEATINGNPAENLKVKQLAERIVWNFPNATSVSTYRYGVLGSVLAPNADLTGDAGSINGMVVAASFMQKGGMEPHSFPIKNIWPWKVNTARVKIIKTTENGEIEIPNEALANMEFSIHNSADEKIAKLSADNNFTSGKLTQGTYTIWEDVAPNKYQKLNEAIVTFTVGSNGAITNWTGSSSVKFDTKDSFLVAKINNELIPYVEKTPHQIGIKKIDTDTKKSIPNAKFTLEKENQSKWTEQNSLISRPDGKSDLIELSEGTYRLREVTPAKGYVGMTDYIGLNVDNDLELTVTHKPKNVTVQSTKAKTLFIIENKLETPKDPKDPKHPKNPINPSKPNPNSPSNPQGGTKLAKKTYSTGDKNPISLGILVLSLSLGTIVVLRINQKKKNI